jgi:hypothetical protein
MRLDYTHRDLSPFARGPALMTPTPDDIDTTRLILIVVGAHLRAEVADRPLAEALRERAQEWVDAKRPSTDDPDWVEPQIVVCTDIWYLNNDDLRAQPTISVGAPGVNALAAYLADRLEMAFVVEDVLAVQVDLDFADPVASCWGTDPDSTAQAVEAFCDRYLDGFLEGAVRRLAESA